MYITTMITTEAQAKTIARNAKIVKSHIPKAMERDTSDDIDTIKAGR
jgi:hypothetical protein